MESEQEMEGISQLGSHAPKPAAPHLAYIYGLNIKHDHNI